MTFTSHIYYCPKMSRSIPISIFIYNFACHRFHHLPIHIKSISVTDFSSKFVFSDLPSVLPANRYKSAVAQLTTSCIMEFFTPVICNAFIHFNWPHSHSKKWALLLHNAHRLGHPHFLLIPPPIHKVPHLE